jgi:hypothetical protein
MKCLIIPLVIGAIKIMTKSFKKKIGNHSKETVIIFTTKGNYTWNITHNTESIAG